MPSQKNEKAWRYFTLTFGKRKPRLPQVDENGQALPHTIMEKEKSSGQKKDPIYNPQIEKKKNPSRQQRAPAYESQIDGTQEKELSTIKLVDIIEFNSRAEQRAVEILQDMLAAETSISLKQARIELAFELNISMETAKRYILKHTARRAEFKLTEKGLELR